MAAGNSRTSHATAIEASLKLDISHNGSALPARSPAKHTHTNCGRGLAPDGGGSANPSISHAAAIEASLKLDISHN